MAIDDALLQNFDPDRSLPILRLYGWSPAALSIGRFQHAQDTLESMSCQAAGLPVVRRITGGGAIYHADELTYSIVCSPEQIPPASSVKDSFRVLTGFLLEFYRRLNLDVSYATESSDEPKQLGERTAFCFAGRETFDILVAGKKIGGNAQRRLKNRIFQHGSIPVVNHSETGLSFMRDQSPEHIRGATSLSECGVHSDADRLRQVIADAFQVHFGVTLIPEGLSKSESKAADLLLCQKYLSDSWNLEGIDP